jgi:hypothetical protein
LPIGAAIDFAATGNCLTIASDSLHALLVHLLSGMTLGLIARSFFKNPAT